METDIKRPSATTTLQSDKPSAGATEIGQTVNRWGRGRRLLIYCLLSGFLLLQFVTLVSVWRLGRLVQNGKGGIDANQAVQKTPFPPAPLDTTDPPPLLGSSPDIQAKTSTDSSTGVEKQGEPPVATDPNDTAPSPEASVGSQQNGSPEETDSRTANSHDKEIESLRSNLQKDLEQLQEQIVAAITQANEIILYSELRTQHAELLRRLDRFVASELSLKERYLAKSTRAEHKVCLVFFNAGEGASPLILAETVKEFLKSDPYFGHANCRLGVATKEGIDPLREHLTLQQYDDGAFEGLDVLQKQVESNPATVNDYAKAAEELLPLLNSDDAGSQSVAVWLVGEGANPPQKFNLGLGDIRVHVLHVVGNRKKAYSAEENILRWIEFCRVNGGTYQLIQAVEEEGSYSLKRPADVTRELRRTTRPEWE